MLILTFFSKYAFPPKDGDERVKELPSIFCLTDFPQPKRIWDALNKDDQVVSIYQTDPSSNTMIKDTASLAAFRRGVTNSAFLRITFDAKRPAVIPPVLQGGEFYKWNLTNPEENLKWQIYGVDDATRHPNPQVRKHKARFLIEKSKVHGGALGMILDKAVAKENVDKQYLWILFNDPRLDFLGNDGQAIATKDKKRENDIFVWLLSQTGIRSFDFVAPRSYGQEYEKIRSLVKKEKPGNIFKWNSVCQQLAIKSNLSDVRELAKTFGVPQQFWNNPRKVCALVAPRASEFLEKVHCDNAGEPTMDGDDVGSIPEYLKYTFTAPNGQTYCSNILDLYNAVNSGQTMEPYRRFPLDRDDINDRVAFLNKVIEPHGLGQGVLGKIRDTMITLTPGQQLRARLIQVWGKLRYPKYQIEEVMTAGEDVLNGIFAALTRQEGIFISGQEKDAFRNTTGKLNEKRRILIDTMYRIVNIEDPSGTNLVSLELAINDSSPQANVRPREDDDLAAEGTMRAAPTARTQQPQPWRRGMILEEGDEVEFGGRTYRANRTIYTVNEPVGNLAYDFITDWRENESVRAGEIVRFNGQLYRANRNLHTVDNPQGNSMYSRVQAGIQQPSLQVDDMDEDDDMDEAYNNPDDYEPFDSMGHYSTGERMTRSGYVWEAQRSTGPGEWNTQYRNWEQM